MRAQRVLWTSCVGFTQGERIGNYRVELDLGPTDSGCLLQGEHLVLPRRAIIKVVQTAFATDPRLVVRTLREACILDAVAHPGVPIVYEAGLVDERWPWFAFETCTGPTLDAVLESGAISVIEVAALVRDLSDILEHAHHRGVIHRGIRPTGIVLTAGRRFPLCLPDWSQAIVHDATGHVQRVVAEASRSYAAPELLRASTDGVAPVIDGRTDVFALGVIAHRALTGSLPFAQDPGVEPHVSSHERRPDAHRGLTALIDAMLAFERTDRPTASEVRAGIDWLFATAPELQAPVELSRKALLAVAEFPVPPIMSPDDLVALARRQRVRRPRWTPEMRYVEVAEVLDDGAIAGEVVE